MKAITDNSVIWFGKSLKHNFEDQNVYNNKRWKRTSGVVYCRENLPAAVNKKTSLPCHPAL